MTTLLTDEELQGIARTHWMPTGNEFLDCAHAIIAAHNAKQPPVAAQSKWDGEQEWSECSIEHHHMVQAKRIDWPGYQTRLLYAFPQEPEK